MGFERQDGSPQSVEFPFFLGGALPPFARRELPRDLLLWPFREFAPALQRSLAKRTQRKRHA